MNTINERVKPTGEIHNCTRLDNNVSSGKLMIATLNNILYSEKSWYTNYPYFALVSVQGYNIRA